MSNDEPVDGNCNYHPTQDGGYCGQRAGMGTDHLGEGYCKYHGGAAPGGAREGAGAPEENTNSVSHGAYADQSNLYSEKFTDPQRQIADDIYEDYRERYLETHGDIPTGHDLRLFKLSVNAVTELRVENWSTQKPDDLDSGTVMIDRETRIKTHEHGTVKEIRYKKAPALAAKKTLSNENRKWLKDLGLLDSPEDRQADALEAGLDLTLSTEEKDELDQAFDVEPQT
ncbi:hypothetical protein [Halopelagius fulvigenes]|uniref:Uncharacterized protein n=1 Tax=Halopelagius fulvigenes TaxID=1198324 RepID=A0ABD5TYT0_9EURY